MKLTSSNPYQTAEFILPNSGSVLIRASGGIDSTLILYLSGLLNNIEINVHVCSQSDKGSGHAVRVKEIIKHISDKLGYEFVNNLYVSEVKDEVYDHDLLERCVKDGHADLIISGVTSNPLGTNNFVVDKHGIEQNVGVSAPIESRNYNPNKSNYFIKHGLKYYSPFNQCDKRFIAHMFRSLNIMDLLPLTRSCESEAHNSNNFADPCHLAECWWCMERIWAFPEEAIYTKG